MAGLFETEVELLGDQQEVVVVYFGFFGLFVHGFEEGGLYFLVFGVLA